MNHHTTADFWDCCGRLPEAVQRLADANYELLRDDPWHAGTTLPPMGVSDVQTVVSELFPRHISLQSPDQADDVIPELMAFWQYLKREFHLPQADAVLEFLRDVEPDFPGIMNDSSNFGMAKSFFMMGQAAGFDMTTKKGLDAFMMGFNTGQLSRPSSP